MQQEIQYGPGRNVHSVPFIARYGTTDSPSSDPEAADFPGSAVMGPLWLLKVAWLGRNVEGKVERRTHRLSASLASLVAGAAFRYATGKLRRPSELRSIAANVENKALFREARNELKHEQDIAAEDVRRHLAEIMDDTTNADETSRQAAAMKWMREERERWLKPYRSVFQGLDEPPIADVFMHDRVFARLRVAGYNPLSLRRIRSESKPRKEGDPCNQELPFEIEEQMPFKGDTVAAALEEGRFFALDYAQFRHLKQREEPADQRVYATQALFALPPSGGELMPVAIKIWLDENDSFVEYPPVEDDAAVSGRWATAKIAVNQNDAMHHELIAHLGRTHIFMERFVAATRRQLPPSHPLYKLLISHFDGTGFINTLADSELISEHGDVSIIFAGDRKEVLDWTMSEVSQLHFNNMMPDIELDERGLMDSRLNAPYRDDALAHFEAFVHLCNRYLGLYYPSDEKLLEDKHIRNWAREIVHPDFGATKGFGDLGDGIIRSRSYLARALAFIMFSASVQHAAVNFPQKTYMSYAPAVPGALWQPPPHPSEPCDVNRWLMMLSPPDVTLTQVRILHVIGELLHTRIGQYPHVEARARPIVAEYRKELRQIGRSIRAREMKEGRRKDGLKYEFLHPNNVPRSINI